MTPEQQEWVRKELGPRIDALELALNSIDPSKPDTAAGVRKLLQSLQVITRGVELEEISGAAALAVTAADADLKSRTAGFIQMLREQSRQSQTAETAVLVMGSDAAVMPALEQMLRTAGREVVKAAGAKEAETILREREIVFIVSDLYLPDQDVRQFISNLRLRPLMAAVPIIVVTSKVSAEEANLADLLQDVDAFFGRPLDMEQIQEAMEQRLRRAHEHIRAAHRDPLTGLLNRAAFGEYFDRAMQQNRKNREPVAVAVMKIDRYQELCEKYGTHTGEKMLRHFGAVLSRYFRATDVVARWSGCEFMALFPGEDNKGGTRAMERIRQALAREPFAFPDGTSAPLKIYAGVSVLAEQSTITGAIDQADKFMHQAKSEGGDRVVSPLDQGPKTRERLVLVTSSDSTSRVLNHLLAKENYVVQTFQKTDEACFKHLETSKCHLVIIDDGGPGAFDPEALKKIRALPRQSRTPILLLTAREEIAVSTHDLGGSDYARKPLDLMGFMKSVRRLLTRGLGDDARGEGQESLLVISNDLHTLMILGTALQKQTGFVILLARGVRDGIMQLNKRRPAVALVDIKPRGTDWQPLIEALTVVRPAPITVMAVDAEDVSFVRGIKSPPIKGVIPKPLAPLNIARQVQDIVGILPAAAAGRQETAEILKEEVDRIMRIVPG